jgi:hypothetical protein
MSPSAAAVYTVVSIQHAVGGQPLGTVTRSAWTCSRLPMPVQLQASQLSSQPYMFSAASLIAWQVLQAFELSHVTALRCANRQCNGKRR